MNKQAEMTFDEWVKEYKPMMEDGCLMRFDWTSSDDVKKLNEVGPLRVWTMVWEGSESCILSGYHRVNRMEYYITEKQRAADIDIVVV